jgi:hypothetical protein
MSAWDDFFGRLKSSNRLVIVGLFAFVAAVAFVDLALKPLGFVDLLQSAIAARVVPALNPEQAKSLHVLASALVIEFLLIICLFIIAANYYLFSKGIPQIERNLAAAEKNRESAEKNLTAANDLLVQTTTRLMQIQDDNVRQRAALQAQQGFLELLDKEAGKVWDRVRLWMRPAPIRMVAEETVATIASNGDVRIETSREFVALAEPVYVLAWKLEGGKDLERFDQLKLGVSPSDRVAFFPARNRKLEKSFFLFFFPGVMPGETMRYSVSYEWPGTFEDLTKPKSSDDFILESILHVPSISINFRFHESLGPIKVAHSGDSHVQFLGEAKVIDFNEHRYKMQNVAAKNADKFVFDRLA